jgi:hypothetical protein
VRGKRAILRNPRLTQYVMDNVQSWNNENIKAQCGDNFVNGVDLGAELFVTLKFEFANKDVKTDFDANIKLDFVSLFEVEGAAKVAFDKYKDNVSVKLLATQIGGKPSQLTSILGKPEGGSLHLIECSLQNRQACEQSLEAILRYARDNFSKQIDNLSYDPTKPDGAAFLKYNVESYYSAGLTALYPNPAEVVKLEVAEARDRLLGVYLRQSRDRARAEAVLGMRLSDDELRVVTRIRDDLSYNVMQLVNAAQVCYEKPGNCVATEADTTAKLRSYNPKDLNKVMIFYDYCVKSDKSDALKGSVEAIKKALDFKEDGDCAEVEMILNNEFVLDLTNFGGGILSDLRPLTNLKRMTELKIRNQKIRDLSPLATLTNLTSLDLRGNSINNAEALAGLGKMKSLDLAYNRLVDLSPLSKLTSLEEIRLQKNNGIRDFAPVMQLPLVKTRYLSFDDICEQEREFAISFYKVRADQAEYYRDTNFAPVFKDQSNRQSGVTGWANCNYVGTLY